MHLVYMEGKGEMDLSSGEKLVLHIHKPKIVTAAFYEALLKFPHFIVFLVLWLLYLLLQCDTFYIGLIFISAELCSRSTEIWLPHVTGDEKFECYGNNYSNFLEDKFL